MYEEMLSFGHSTFAEVYPPTVALHDGLKAVYGPHPVFFNRIWPLEESIRDSMRGSLLVQEGIRLRRTTRGKRIITKALRGTIIPNLRERFGDAGWDTRNKDARGREFEDKETGRMCLRVTLLHPIEWEHDSV